MSVQDQVMEMFDALVLAEAKYNILSGQSETWLDLVIANKCKHSVYQAHVSKVAKAELDRNKAQAKLLALAKDLTAVTLDV